MALLDGDAYRQASYANIAWTLARRRRLQRQPAQEPRRRQARGDRGREDGYQPHARAATDQILMSLQDLRGNPATPANVAAALDKMNDAYVERFGKELKMVKEGAVSGKYEHDVDTFFVESQHGLGIRHRRARRLLRQRRADPRRRLFLRALQLPDRARRSRCGRERQRRSGHDGAPPRLQADRRPDRDHVATCQRRRFRRHSRRRTQRRDRRDGRGRRGCSRTT